MSAHKNTITTNTLLSFSELTWPETILKKSQERESEKSGEGGALRANCAHATVSGRSALYRKRLFVPKVSDETEI